MLEVSPEMAHMMDTIIMTFVYVEQLRKDKEQAVQVLAHILQKYYILRKTFITSFGLI